MRKMESRRLDGFSYTHFHRLPSHKFRRWDSHVVDSWTVIPSRLLTPELQSLPSPVKGKLRALFRRIMEYLCPYTWARTTDVDHKTIYFPREVLGGIDGRWYRGRGCGWASHRNRLRTTAFVGTRQLMIRIWTSLPYLDGSRKVRHETRRQSEWCS